MLDFTTLPTPQAGKHTPGAVAIGRCSPISITGGHVPANWPEEILRLLAGGDGAAPIALKSDARLPAEGYELQANASGLQIAAGGEAGFRYALRRLEQIMRDFLVPPGQIRDFPSLAIRGLHINFHALAKLGRAGCLELLNAMARWNFNTALFEYGDRYPYTQHKQICRRNALTRSEVSAIITHARSLGIEPIPLQQCLGHVNYILRHEAYAHLREEDDQRDQWCPLKPETLELFAECVDDMLADHPGIRYFHIGGDEARRLGQCPNCRREAEKKGIGRLYADFVTKAVAYIRARGLTPIIWDDMLCRHAEILDDLPREVVIMYWDYWTTRDPSATFVARPDGHGVVADRRWLNEWANELGPVERRMLEQFAKPMDFQTELSEKFLAKFGSYLGAEFPKRIRAFPYLEYYQDHGFKVIGAAAGGSNESTWHSLPDFPRYADNINTFCRRLQQAQALGIITTAWYDFPIDALVPAIIYTGQASWNTISTTEV